MSQIIGDVLTSADYVNLERRWINRDLADSAGIRRVDPEGGRSLLCRRDSGSYEGLAIPYSLPGQHYVREWRVRRDRPDIEYRNGKPVERGKYLAPAGHGNMIYFVPGLPPELLKAVPTTVVVTEGEFKTLALWRLANHDSCAPRFLPLGLGGVWNWRGVIGKTTGPNGDRRNVKGAVPDLDHIVWQDRRVIIAFDADSEKNEHVDQARKAFARELRMRGAEVASVTWDIALGKGVDDVLANAGPQRVLQLLDQADFEEGEYRDNISVHQVAEAITTRLHFARGTGERLHVFRGGTYHDDGAAVVRQQVKELLNRMSIASKWSSHKAEEVVKYIAVDAPALWERPNLTTVNVLNGLLDIKTRTLTPHSPEFLSTVQLPVAFNQAAQCPQWDKFIDSVFPGDSKAIAWEIPAWLMTPDTSIQKAVLLLGDGANGKSTYLRALRSFLGQENVSNVSLQRLENDRFSVARLVGRLANICPDLPSDDLSSTSIFKAITGGDVVLGERKFEEAFEFLPFCRLIYSANHPPKSQDASAAFFRRWIVIPFDRTFGDSDPGTLNRDELDAAMADPVELSGVLNRALNAIGAIRTEGLSDSESMRRAMDDFRQTTDPFAVWLDRKTVLKADFFTPADRLWHGYNQDCIANGRPTISKTSLGRSVAQLRPTAEKRQKTVDCKVTWGYAGLHLV